MKFEFYNPTHLIFGAGTLSQLGEVLSKHGKKALIVTGGDFYLRYDSPRIDTSYDLKRGYLPGPYPNGLLTTDFEGDYRIADGDGTGETAVDIEVDEFIPNLRAFIEDLADSGELDEATAVRLLEYVDAAQMAQDEDDKKTAIIILNELVADVEASICDTEMAHLIEIKIPAVIEEI